jgi:hypothetical protein
MDKSISFGLSFIFSFFFAGLTGYYLAEYMGLAPKARYFLAALATILTIIV